MTKRIDYFARHGIAKANPQALVLRKLRSFLDANESSLVRFLANLWRTQGKAITYKELREAILNGDISEEYMEEWRQDYTLLVSETMRPAWEAAIKAAEAEVAAKYPGWNYNPMAEEVSAWTQNHAGEFVTSVTQSQIDGLRAVVRRAATLGDMNVDTLSRVIRPMIGLYEQQAVANMKYYETLIENGATEKRALDLSIRYGAQQHRYRSYLVARQELAMAYNTGAHWGTKAAQDAGLLGEMVKVACCADDERVCPICRELDGVIVGMDEGFNVQNRGTYKFTTQYPPFHIGCRCAVLYKEIEPPAINKMARYDEIIEIEKFNPYHDSKGRFTSGGKHGKMNGTKYAPSLQRNARGIQLSPKTYAKLTGTLNTRFPGLKSGEKRIIRDSSTEYFVEADGFGGFVALRARKIQK